MDGAKPEMGFPCLRRTLEAERTGRGWKPLQCWALRPPRAQTESASCLTGLRRPPQAPGVGRQGLRSGNSALPTGTSPAVS